MANIVAIQCPSCGGDVQLDSEREFGFCIYCGTKIYIPNAIQKIKGTVNVDRSDMLQSYLVLGRRSIELHDYAEALKNYDQALIISPFDNHAMLGKALAMAALSSPTEQQGLQYLKQYGVKSFLGIWNADTSNAYTFAGGTLIDLANMMINAFSANYTNYANKNGVGTLFNEMAGIINGFCINISNDDFANSLNLIDDYERLCDTVLAMGSRLGSQNIYGISGIITLFKKRKSSIGQLRKNYTTVYWRDHAEEWAALTKRKKWLEQKIKTTSLLDISSRSSMKQKLRIVVDRLENPNKP